MALFCAATSATLKADTFEVTYDAAGVEVATAGTICGSASKCLLDEETFDSAWGGTIGNFNATWTQMQATNVTGDSITGVYTGGTATTLYDQAAGQYGGGISPGETTGGYYYYPEVTNGSYTLTLTPHGAGVGVNYFGLWVSALDADNTLKIYNNGGTLLYTLTAASLISVLGACPGGPYCGNPDGTYKGQDANEQFVFLNFYDMSGGFSKVTFSEADASGFESDNQTVGFVSTIVPTGTEMYFMGPEPGSFALLSMGAAALMALRRRRARGR